MRVAVRIEFECNMQDERDLQFNLEKVIKPTMDFYNTRADITVIPMTYSFKVEGLWNG